MEKYILNSDESKIFWKGSNDKMTNRGEVEFHSGVIEIDDDGEIQNANITIDMTSIKTTEKDLGEDDRTKLTKHLKSPDFLHVDLFKSATFTLDHANITEGSGFINGRIGIKGNNFEINLPCKVEEDNGTFKAEGEFDIAKISQQLHRFIGEGYEETTPKTIISYKLVANKA